MMQLYAWKDVEKKGDRYIWRGMEKGEKRNQWFPNWGPRRVFGGLGGAAGACKFYL